MIAVSTLVPIGWRPKTGHVHLERIGAFLLLGASISMAFPRRRLACALCVCLLAGGLELAQVWIPSRHGRLPDALEKMVGAVLGVVFGRFVGRRPTGPARSGDSPSVDR